MTEIISSTAFISLCGCFLEASAKVRGVLPSTVDARMKNPASPEATELSVLIDNRRCGSVAFLGLWQMEENSL